MALSRTHAAKIFLLGRSELKVKPVLEQIKSLGSVAFAQYVECDLSAHASVRNAAAVIGALTDKIDVLINNAGVVRLQCPHHRRMLLTVVKMCIRELSFSKDGNEMHLASNFLGHFLLSRLLLPKLQAASTSRVISVTSDAYKLNHFHPEDPNYKVLCF